MQFSCLVVNESGGGKGVGKGGSLKVERGKRKSKYNRPGVNIASLYVIIKKEF
jgi:hypothetical protein